MTSAMPQATVTVRYAPRGGAQALFACRDREVLLDGPANTGKSFAALQKVHLALTKYPGARWLLLRKTLVSLKASTLVTYRERVVAPGEVTYWVSKGAEGAHFQYRNGSKLYIGGMDNHRKIMSTEYDGFLWDEATDGELDQWEALTTRLRYGVMPYQQGIACVNPQQPTHWLNERANSGRMTRILSRHEDNPTITPQYLAALDALTGARRSRLYLGLWAAAEGMVYQDAWEPARSVLPRARFSSRPESLWGDCGIDRAWPRYVGIDWGFRNPAVVKWYALRPDGELLVYRELYQTHTLVEDLAREALTLMGWRLNEQGALLPTRPDADPLPRELIGDHDAEDRATWERHFGMAVFPADKGKDSISDGIQAVTKRLNDGRLQYLADSLVRRDAILEAAKKPCGSVEEFESYVWDLRGGRAPKEAPVDADNHGMDVDRYVVRYFDRGEPDARRIAFSATGY